MTETARKTLEELEKKMTEEINKKVENKTIGEACDDAMTTMAVLAGCINKIVIELDDPVLGMGGAALTMHLVEVTKAIGTFNQLCEVAAIIHEQEKNKK